MKALQLQGTLFDMSSIQCALGNTHAMRGMNIQSMNQYFWVGIASVFNGTQPSLRILRNCFRVRWKYLNTLEFSLA